MRLMVWLFTPLILAGPAVAAPVAERIVVTTKRQASDAAGAPESISRLEAAALDRLDADHAAEALNRIAGVNIHRGNGVEHLTAIRSPVLTGGAGAGSFLYLEDGVPLRAAGFGNVNALFEANTELAEAIEVVKGPGSALFGSNAVHGIINVLTPAPEVEGGRLKASAGSFERLKSELGVTRTGDFGGLYAGVSALDENGWRDAASVDQQKALARWDWSGAAWRAATTMTFQNLNQETAGFIEGPEAYEDRALARSNPDPEGYRDARSWRVASRIERDAGVWTLTATPFARWTQLSFAQTFVPTLPIEENEHASLGALVTAYAPVGGAGLLILGIDLDATTGALSEVQTAPSLGSFAQGVHYDFAVDARTAAAYAHLETPLAGRWSATLGVRAEATRYDYDNRTDDGDLGRFRRPTDRSDDFFAATPKLSVQRRGDDGSLVWARYAAGARAPQVSDLYRLQINQDPDGAAFETETLQSVELGWRGALGPVAIDATGFAMEKSGGVFRDADGFNVEDATTHHLGAELDASTRLNDRTELALSATYARHTYGFDRPVASIPQASEAIREGDDVDSAPRWLANARLVWRPVEVIETEAEWVFVGEYFTDAANNNVYPGHTIVNLRATWAATEVLDLYAVLRNAFDERYAERADFAFGSERYFPGEPRALTLGLAARWP